MRDASTSVVRPTAISLVPPDSSGVGTFLSSKRITVSFGRNSRGTPLCSKSFDLTNGVSCGDLLGSDLAAAGMASVNTALLCVGEHHMSPRRKAPGTTPSSFLHLHFTIYALGAVGDRMTR
jgi:hypothetical protein